MKSLAAPSSSLQLIRAKVLSHQLPCLFISCFFVSHDIHSIFPVMSSLEDSPESTLHCHTKTEGNPGIWIIRPVSPLAEAMLGYGGKKKERGTPCALLGSKLKNMLAWQNLYAVAMLLGRAEI